MMFDLNVWMLLFSFLAFIAFLLTLTFLARIQTVKTQRAPKGNSSGLTLNLPVKYHHVLTVSSFSAAQTLMGSLNREGLTSALHQGKGNLTLEFTAPQKLLNVDELKREGLIKKAEIKRIVGGK